MFSISRSTQTCMTSIVCKNKHNRAISNVTGLSVTVGYLRAVTYTCLLCVPIYLKRYRTAVSTISIAINISYPGMTFTFYNPPMIMCLEFDRCIQRLHHVNLFLGILSQSHGTIGTLIRSPQERHQQHTRCRGQ